MRQYYTQKNTQKKSQRRNDAALFLLLALTVLLCACGVEDGPNEKGTPLWNMNYKIVSIADNVPTDNLRAAFIWAYSLEDGGIASIRRDLPLSPEFPSTFSIELFELPPEIAMQPVKDYEPFLGEDYTCGGMPDPEYYTPEQIAQIIEEEGIVPCPEETTDDNGSRWVVGKLVIYSDNNNNQLLDTLAPEANLEDIVDRIVGPAESIFVIYVEGDPSGTPLEAEFDVTPGLNVYVDDVKAAAIDDELTITLSTNDDMQGLMCESPVEGPRDSWESTLSQFISALDEAPADTDLECSDDGLNAVFFTTEEVGATMCRSGSLEKEEWILALDSASDAPAEWPCTIP